MYKRNLTSNYLMLVKFFSRRNILLSIQLSNPRQVSLGAVPMPFKGETTQLTRVKTPVTNSFSTEVKMKTASLTRNKPTST